MLKMVIQYYAKVTNMQNVEVAIAHNDAQVKLLRNRRYEPCSRAFYESALRNNASALPQNEIK